MKNFNLLKDALWVLITLGGIVYGYGTLNTKVQALEANNPIQMGKDIVELKVELREIKSDVKDIKRALKIP